MLKPGIFKCTACGYIYDEGREGFKMSELPETWKCPMCRSEKGFFNEITKEICLTNKPFKMEKSLKGTKTEKNVMKSFAGESQARNRYEFFASVAKKEGYEQIAAIFQETANQEKEHAKRFFKFLEGGMAEITAGYPAGKIGTTKENLKAAAEGENEEWTKVYPEFAETAKMEGFKEIATAFKLVAKVEAEHERVYMKLLKNISEDKVFVKDGKVWWKCLNCGYVYESERAYDTCPACLHPRAFMAVREENY